MEEKKLNKLKILWFCNLHQGEDFIQKIMVLIGLQGYVQQKYHES